MLNTAEMPASKNRVATTFQSLWNFAFVHLWFGRHWRRDKIVWQRCKSLLLVQDPLSSVFIGFGNLKSRMPSHSGPRV